jgi:hypothetical protein
MFNKKKEKNKLTYLFIEKKRTDIVRLLTHFKILTNSNQIKDKNKYQVYVVISRLKNKIRNYTIIYIFL